MDPFADTTIPFSFEAYVESKILPPLIPEGQLNKDPKFRTVVCTHWLSGLCQSGSSCQWLHKLDKSKTSACKYGKSCRIRNCPFKHINLDEKKECPFYKQGAKTFAISPILAMY